MIRQSSQSSGNPSKIVSLGEENATLPYASDAFSWVAESLRAERLQLAELLQKRHDVLLKQLGEQLGGQIPLRSAAQENPHPVTLSQPVSIGLSEDNSRQVELPEPAPSDHSDPTAITPPLREESDKEWGLGDSRDGFAQPDTTPKEEENQDLIIINEDEVAGDESQKRNSGRNSRFSNASADSANFTKNRFSRGPRMEAPDMMEGALQLVSIFKEGSKKARCHGWFTCNHQVSLETAYFMERHPCRGRIRILVISPLFDLFFGLVVITSVGSMGVEIQAAAENLDKNFDNSHYLTSQLVCCLLFVLELVLRVVAFGKGFFGLGVGTFIKMWKWNTFDLLCTVSMIVDLALEYQSASDGANIVGQSRQGRILRFFRLMRIVRALRVLRMVEFARELRKMSYALQYSFHTLLWAMLLLAFVMYFFATAFTQATTEALISADGDTQHLMKLHELYGTIPKSYLSLFQAISGGADWHHLSDPLGLHTHWINMLLFVAYIAMTIFGVMNVITSVFVESALASVQHYKDLLIQENTKQKEVYVTHLREVFACIDLDNSGEISHDEMDRLLHDTALQQYLESIEIHPDDARTLFRLLDEDSSGLVNIDEFCKGCLKLKGEAKSYDVHCLLYENTRLIRKWQQYMDYLEHGFLPKMIKEVKRSVAAELGPKQMDKLKTEAGEKSRTPRSETPTPPSSVAHINPNRYTRVAGKIKFIPDPDAADES